MRGLVLLGGTVLAALLTWAPVISDTPEQAISETPLLVLVSVLLLLAAVTVRATDKRLSWVIAAAGFAWLMHPGAAPTESLRISLDRADMVMSVRGWPASVTWMLAFAVVVLGVHLVRGLPARLAGRAWTDWLGLGLVGLAVFEVLYSTLQFVGLDPIWAGWHVAPGRLLVVGTLGNSGAVSLLLALAAPFAPLAVLPVLAWGFLVVQGKLAIVAAVAGVAWQHRERLLLAPPWARALAAVWIAVPIWVALVWHGTASVTERLRIAGFGLSDLLTSPLVGQGPGSWAWRIPAMQFAGPIVGSPAAYTSPHSDLLGWAHATGIIGLLALGWWLWGQARAAVVSTVGGAWVALMICMLGWSVSTIPTLALPAILIWGTATGKEARW